MHSCEVCVDTVCLHTDVPVFVLRSNTHCNWHFSSAEQHKVPSGHHSLASVDSKGQVWLANASLHITADFRPPPPLAPVNQELMKGILWHMRHLTHMSLRTSFSGQYDILNTSPLMEVHWFRTQHLSVFSLLSVCGHKGVSYIGFIQLLNYYYMHTEVILPVSSSQWWKYFTSEP